MSFQLQRRLFAVARRQTSCTQSYSYGYTRAAPRAATATATATATRRIHQQSPHRAQQNATGRAEDDSVQSEALNPALQFPCLDALESKSATLSRRSLQGPEPSYTSGHTEVFHSEQPMLLDWGGILPQFDVAYETWGRLNDSKSNAILLHTGLSASSHAHSTAANPKPGWWERFIGPDKPLDTNKYFVICTNVVGGCYGSTGPSSLDPATGERYATRFPILTMEDMVRAQFRLLDQLGVHKLYASVGSSMGGMQSLAAGNLFPERVGRIVSISGCARSHPYSIAMRHTQRQALMMDPNWARGFYYDSVPPHGGMKLAREIATVTYRSGPEWEMRFGRRRADPSRPPALCPDFLVETYLDHAGEKWCLEYDPNSLLYVSKAMDMFDLGQDHRNRVNERRAANAGRLQAYLDGKGIDSTASVDACSLTLPAQPYEEKEQPADIDEAHIPATDGSEPPPDLVAGLRPLAHTPALVLGVASDILFPAWQQREIATTLRRTGNTNVTHIELGEEKSMFGHDTFLLDLDNVGGAVKSFLG